MKKLGPIFARDNKGKVREVTYEVEENRFRSVHGAQGDKFVTDEWTICEGKNIGRSNETTPEEQALLDATSKWEKKLKSGGYWEDIKDIDKVKFVEPMLAEKYLEHKDKIDWKTGVYVSPKMDGLRCIITKDGCFSRNGKIFVSFPHISTELTKVFQKYPELILDGEIYAHKFSDNFNKIISLAKKTKPKPEDLIESEKHLQYWIFDTPFVNGGYGKRYEWLCEMIIKFYPKNKYIKLCDHQFITDQEEIEPFLALCISRGFEGLMINLPDGEYENKRSKNLLKYKLFTDEEFEIVDMEEGIGNRSGMFGRAILKTKGGIVFEANSRGNEVYYIKLLKEKKNAVGKMATVRYQNLTPDGKPRFGVILAIRDYE